MNIVIIGGGSIGVTIAEKLISEGYKIILIEENENIVKRLTHELDALVIHGNGTDINILKEIDIENAFLFLALTNDDNTNMIACSLVKKLTGSKITAISKIEHSNYYFDNDIIKQKDFGIDMMIEPVKLSIEKITTLLNYPEAIEIINYSDKRVQLVGIRITNNFKYINKPFHELVLEDELFKNIKAVAIYRNEEILIPKGTDVVLPKDKLYLIGKYEHIQNVLKTYFHSKTKLNNIIISGATKMTKELSKRLTKKGKKVTIIEEDTTLAENLSKDLDDVIVINGSATDISVINDIEIDNSCFISISNDDEYNVISAVTAKKYNAKKTICTINNKALAPIVNSMTNIDIVFSPHVLMVGEILHYCRKGNIISITPFAEINAETVGMEITEPIGILNTPLQNIKFPRGMIIGVIIRDEEVIIPKGQDMIQLGDKIIIFNLPSALQEIEKMFSKKSVW